MATLNINNLREFDVNELKPCQFYLFVGKSKSGKTTTCKYIYKELAKKQLYDSYIIFSTTNDLRSIYDDDFPTTWSTDPSDEGMESKLLAYLNFQSYWSSIGMKMKGAIIMDDVSDDIIFKKRRSPLLKILTTGRHVGIEMFCLIHNANVLEKNIKPHWDIIFVYYSTDPGELSTIHATYLGGIMKKEDYIQFNDSYLSKGEGRCLIIDRTVGKSDAQDRVFKFQSPSEDKLDSGPVVKNHVVEMHKTLLNKDWKNGMY